MKIMRATTMTEFVRGMQDRIEGKPALPGETQDYYEGFAYQYEKDEKQEAQCLYTKS